MHSTINLKQIKFQSIRLTNLKTVYYQLARHLES